MQTEFIRLHDVVRKIAQKTIFQQLSCSIAQGDTVAIVGANGAGKTTLLKLICGLIKPDAGSVYIAQTDFAKISFAPDTPALYMHDRVETFLQFIAELKKVPKQQINSRIENCLQVLDLESVKHNYIHTLSKGLQQRLNLAQALVNNPELLVLDEPTNALDAAQCENFCKFIQLLQRQGTTIIIASHQYTDVIPLCDYMLRLKDQQLQKIMPPLQNKDIKETNDQLHYTT